MQIRPAVDDDAHAIGRIAYEAFQSHADAHGTVSDFRSKETALAVAQIYVADPSVYSVVAEMDGTIVGSNFMLERDAIRTIGPTSVDGRHQGRGIGRALMEAALEQAAPAQGVRLVQDASNVQSLALYARLGFEVKEPLLIVNGKANDVPTPPCIVRPMRTGDLPGCNELCRKVHGFDRGGELAEAACLHEPFVLLRDGRISAYLSAADGWQANHGVAETNDDLQALIAGICAQRDGELGFYVPTRNARLLRWCLTVGFHGLKTATLMAKGDYREPRGAFLPSANY